MLKDLKRLTEKDDAVDADTMRRCAAQLLERQFLYSDNEKDHKVYFLLKTFKDYFYDLFDALNHEFVVDDLVGMIGVVPRGRTTSVRLKKDEALILLSVRFIYEDAMQNFSHQHGSVQTTSEKLLARYEVATRVDKRPTLTELRRILDMFKRAGIIDILQDDDRVIDFRIRPAIRYVLNESWLKVLELHAGIVTANEDTASDQEDDSDDVDSDEAMPSAEVRS